VTVMMIFTKVRGNLMSVL